MAPLETEVRATGGDALTPRCTGSSITWATPQFWGLVFADDSLWNIPLQDIWTEAALILAVVVGLGTPISWPKTLLGLAMSWVGFEVSYKNWKIGVQLSRAQEIDVLSRPLMFLEISPMQDFVSFTGKLTHCTQALPYLRPLLQPLHSLVAAAGHRVSVRLPVPIRKVIKFIVERLMKHRLRDVKPFRPWISGGGASDGSGGVAAFKILDEGHRRRVINAIGTEDLLQALAGQHQVPEGATDVITAITSGKEKRQALWMGEVFDKLSNKALPLEVCALITPRVGGWWSNFHPSTLTDKKQVKWFSEKIDLDILPCVILDDKGRVNHSGASSMIVEIIAAIC